MLVVRLEESKEAGNQFTNHRVVRYLRLGNMSDASISRKFCTEVLVDLYVGSRKLIVHCLQIQNPILRHWPSEPNLMSSVLIRPQVPLPGKDLLRARKSDLGQHIAQFSFSNSSR